MNKRQRKKRVKQIVESIGKRPLTKQEKHFLKTTGRKEFVKKYEMQPETLEIVIEQTIQEVTRIWEHLKREITKISNSLKDNWPVILKETERKDD